MLRIVSLLSNFALRTSNFQSGRPENRTQHDSVISRWFFSLANAGATSPRLPFKLLAIRSKVYAVFCIDVLLTAYLLPLHLSRVCRNRTALDRPKRSVLAITLHARYLSCQWTCRELNPEALSASQSADPSASPSLVAKRLVWDSNPTFLA